MTSARSSRALASSRSTIEKAAALPSGTAGLAHERLHQPQGLALAPVALAEHPVARLALAIHDEGDGQAARVPVLRRFLLRVQQHREVDVLLLHEGLDALRKLAIVH